ncbi:MAG: iron complex outermembrane receptor protein [Flavobacteriales bacterium]|jgi:iron complex outermembrane receptor protein
MYKRFSSIFGLPTLALPTLPSRALTPLNFVFLILVFFSASSFSNDTTEELVVTGELRNQNVLRLANSVSVINEEAIAARHTKSLEDLFNIAPNVNYSTGASRGRYIQIRGIGERSQFTSPINSSVGVIVDGIDFTGISTGVTALDAQQVEIFRGPQGTLYGANALAGMINVVGSSPTDEFFGKISVGAGSYGSFDTGLILSAPISEALGWRFSALRNKGDGYIENDFLDRKDTNNFDELSLRNHFSFQVNDDASLDLISYFVDVDNGYDAFSLDNNRHTLSDEPGHDRQRTFANAVHFNYSGLSAADINVVASRSDSTIEYGYDEDWSFIDICPIDSDCAWWQYSTFDNYERENTNNSFDARLVSKDNGQVLNWAAGVYYRNQDIDLTRRYTDNIPDDDPYTVVAPVDTVYLSDYSTTNTALYGQLTLALSDSINVIGGLRWEDFSADFSDSDSSVFSPAENLWGGKVALEYSATINTMFYGLISRGYKAGGFNPDPELDDDLKSFSTESMVNYELGSKGSWLDGTLTTQVSAFYQQRSDIQVKQSRAYSSDAGFEFVDFIDNADKGANYGIEIESSWTLNDRVRIFASLGLLETEYANFINLSHVDRNEETGEGYDMSLRDQAHAPTYQYLLGGNFNINPNFYVRLEVEGKDGFLFSESHNEKSGSFNLLNLNVTYEFADVSVSLWGKNLTDETVETRGFYFSHDFGNDPVKRYAPEPYTQKGAPRIFGLSASLVY